jgi:hypothetical protein
MKLLRERYKTREGASKRVRFENALAKGEFDRGATAKLYRYSVTQDGLGGYRVLKTEVGHDGF